MAGTAQQSADAMIGTLIVLNPAYSYVASGLNLDSGLFYVS